MVLVIVIVVESCSFEGWWKSTVEDCGVNVKQAEELMYMVEDMQVDGYCMDGQKELLVGCEVMLVG